MQLRFEQLETRNLLTILMGTPGDDVYSAGPGWANLNGVDYVGDYEFDGGAGDDVASLYDTPGDDTFIAGDRSAELGSQRVTNCEIIHGYAKEGGNDTALLTGLPSDEWVTAEGDIVKVAGVNAYLRAKFFETVEVDGGGGEDWGKVYDSDGDDVVLMNPNDVVFYNTEVSYEFKAFKLFHAYAKSGGYDTAHLYGDSYTYDVDWCRAFGEDTINRAKFFEEVAANRERVNGPTYEPVTGDTLTMTGTHVLRRSIELGDGDTLTGDALLRREDDTVQKNLPQDALEGSTRIVVPDTSGYQVGDELTILAYQTGAECVIVTGLGDDWIDIESPLTQDYTTVHYAAVINYFPLVRAVGTGITIEGVILDGNRDTEVLQWQIIGGGLLHMETTNSVVRDVTVNNAPSTGILMVGGRDNLITHSIVMNTYGHGILMDQEIDTRIEYTTSSYNGDRNNGDGILVNGGAGHSIYHVLARYNERYGLHPAGELTRGGVWSNNDASYNGSNGFHFCYNNVDILVMQNELSNNERSGVGGFGLGGGYADRFNIVTDNVATGNLRYGIETNGGRDNVITFNDVRNNQLGGLLIVGDHTVYGNIE